MFHVGLFCVMCNDFLLWSRRTKGLTRFHPSVPEMRGIRNLRGNELGDGSVTLEGMNTPEDPRLKRINIAKSFQ